MLLRTHLAFAVGVVILFLPRINNKLIFAAVVLVSTLLPDIDTGNSNVGKFIGFKVVQFFAKHRGFIHSFTLCIILSFLLAVFFPSISLAFFLGYSLHLFADSFTKEGIIPFWPYKKRSSGILKTGSLTESSLFLFFIFLDILLFFMVFLDFL